MGLHILTTSLSKSKEEASPEVLLRLVLTAKQSEAPSYKSDVCLKYGGV